MVVQQPQQIDPQRVDPYAQSNNPYGLPAVAERPYVPMQYGSTLPPVPMNQVRDAHNNAAIGSVVVGGLAFCLSLVGVIPGAPFFYYSAGGIIAIIGGARARSRSRRGFGSAGFTPILAIILGSLAAVFMLIGIAIHATATSNALNGSYNNSRTQTGAGTSSGSTSQALPAAPAFGADPTLTQYEASASQLAHSIYTTYNGGQVSATGGVQPLWPANLSESTNGVVMFPSGTAAASIPSDEVVRYVLSNDGKTFDIGITGGTRKEVAIYDSEANEFTWVCDTGAPSNCPAGGLDPNSSGNTTSNS